MKNFPDIRSSSPKLKNKGIFKIKSNYTFTQVASFVNVKTIFSITNALLLFKTVTEILTYSGGRNVELVEPNDTLEPADIYEQQCIFIFYNHLTVR